MTDYTHDPRTPQAAQMARDGSSLSQIAAQFDVSTQTAGRLVKAGGAKVRIPGGKKIGKKPRYIAEVIKLHESGSSVGQIAEAIGDVHASTIAVWLRDEGYTPNYAGDLRTPVRQEDHPRKEEALRRYLAGETAPALSQELGLSGRTVEGWAKQAGLWGQGGIKKRQQDAAAEAVRRYIAGDSITSLAAASYLDYYQIRIALDQAGQLEYPDEDKPDIRCPCGKKTGHPGRKHCSEEHKLLYGVKRQADPANQVTLTCQNCQQEFTRPRSQVNYGKYCSNECASKHTKTKQHIVVEDSVVLDSKWEALFWGLCGFLKIPVERGDRSQAVAIGNGWYCPDFFLPQREIWVEVKGFEDEDDRARYAAWRAAGHLLAVVGPQELEGLRREPSAALMEMTLHATAKIQGYRAAGSTGPYPVR